MPPEVIRRRVVRSMQPAIPIPLKLLRALLLVMAALLALNTLGRLGVVQQYGAGQGIPSIVGAALLAIVGFTFLLACVGAFFLLGAPAKRNWWLALILPLLAVANIATAFVIIPEEHVGVRLVLVAYLFNGLLTVVLIVLLLKRSVRAYFGVSRPPAHVRAA